MSTLLEQRPRPTGRRGIQALIAGVVVVILAVAGLLLLNRGIGTAPYDDAAASGRLTLCDAAGKAVTTGSITDHPFATTVVGASAAGSTYAVPGAEAIVFAYQPREGVAPDGWTALQLSVGTPIADPTHPAAAFSAQDTTLAQFLGGYPAAWDGWVQLRLVLSAPDAPASTEHYDAVDLHIDGDTWTAADPGHADCPSA